MDRITPWPFQEHVTEQAIRKILISENVNPNKWSDDPGEKYTPHVHDYFEIIYVVSGSMIFTYTDEGISVEVKAGDRIEIPVGVVHEAVIGPDGIVCLEGQKKV